MAFTADDRVIVTDQSSQWRGKSGTVLSVDSDGNHVRLDGQQPTQSVLLLDAELTTTTIAPPITYP